MMFKPKVAVAVAVLIATLSVYSSSAMARNKPCSGKKGGVSHCSNGKFVCNNGTISQSKRKCVGR